MKVLNILTGGGIGGIEVLCKDIGLLAPYDNLFCFMTCEGLIYEQMKELGIPVYSLAGKCKFSIFKLKKLINIAKKFDVIVVHHGDIYLNFYYYCLSKICRNKRYVRVMHSCFEGKSDDYGMIKYLASKQLLNMAIGCSDVCIFVSKAGLKSHLKSFHNLSRKRSYVVYNGISIEKLERGRKNEPQRCKPIHILYVGRLHKVKGIDILLNSIAILKKEYSLSLTIVGDGPEWDALHTQAKKLHILDIVHFEGQKTDVIPYLENADIFVYPSVWEEVFGISIVEAMAFGLICIANRVGGIPEIIQDGVNGFLTEEKNVDGLVQTLEKAIKIDSNAELSMRIVAKETAERFSITNTITKLTSILKKLF